MLSPFIFTFIFFFVWGAPGDGNPLFGLHGIAVGAAAAAPGERPAPDTAADGVGAPLSAGVSRQLSPEREGEAEGGDACHAPRDRKEGSVDGAAPATHQAAAARDPAPDDALADTDMDATPTPVAGAASTEIKSVADTDNALPGDVIDERLLKATRGTLPIRVPPARLPA